MRSLTLLERQNLTFNLRHMDVNVNFHLTFHRRYHITDGQPTTCYHNNYHLYIVAKYDFARDSF